MLSKRWTSVSGLPSSFEIPFRLFHGRVSWMVMGPLGPRSEGEDVGHCVHVAKGCLTGESLDSSLRSKGKIGNRFALYSGGIFQESVVFSAEWTSLELERSGAEGTPALRGVWICWFGGPSQLGDLGIYFHSFPGFTVYSDLPTKRTFSITL